MIAIGWINRLGLCVLLALGIISTTLHANLAAEPTQEIGRENPFAALESDNSESKPVPMTIQPEETPDLAMETVVLKFLDATSLRTVLDRMVTPYGAVAVNEANNSVVVCDTLANLPKVLAEIQKADRTPQQVLIEVVILDVQLRDNQEIGINWDLLSHDNYDVIYRQNLTSSRLGSTIEDIDTVGNATAFNTVGFGGDFSVISGTVRHVLHAIQQNRDVDILASPRALVVSGQTATIKAVEEIPYEEVIDTAAGGAAALTSTQFKEVGVNLEVKATITDGNNIFLTVDTEQNARTSMSAGGVPVVDTRRATTSLLLKDGQIVVFGGLRREEKTNETSQIPLLGDLPVVGLLFRSTEVTVHRSELVVLLSPHIDRGQPVPPAIMSRFRNAEKNSLVLSVDTSENASGGAGRSPETSGTP